MEKIVTIAPRSADHSPRIVGAFPRRRRYNAALAIGLIAIVLLAPLPVGSNRGAVWMLWAMVVGSGAAVYLAAVALLRDTRSFRATPMLRWFWLVAAALAFGLLQTLPIAQLLPGWLTWLRATGAANPATISLAPTATFLAVLRGFTMLLFLFLMIEAAARLGRAQTIAWALFFGVAFYAVWGLISLRFFGDTFFWGEKESALGSATGPFVDRTSFAAFLGMGSVLGLALILERVRLPRMRHPAGNRMASAENITALLLWLTLAIILLAQAATQSQQGLVATTAGLMFVWISTPLGDGLRKWRWRVAAIGLAVALIVFATQGGGLFQLPYDAESDPTSLLGLYAQVLHMVGARPIVGFGLDAFQPAYELFHREPVSSAYAWDKAHSTILALWVESGVVFGSLPMIAAGGFAYRLFTVLRAGRQDAALITASLAVMVVVGVHALVDFSFEMQANQFLLLAILALGLARSAGPEAQAPALREAPK